MHKLSYLAVPLIGLYPTDIYLLSGKQRDTYTNVFIALVFVTTKENRSNLTIHP